MGIGERGVADGHASHLTVAVGVGSRMPNPALGLVDRTLLQREEPPVEECGSVIGMDLFEDGRGRQFGGRVAQDALIRRTVVEAVALGVDQGDHVGGIFGDDAKELFAIRGPSVGEVDPKLLGNERQEQPKDQVRGGTRESHGMWTSRERSAEYGFS